MCQDPQLRQQRVLDRFELVSDIGEPDEGTACVMSLVAHLAGEGHTDRPACASPLIRGFVIPVNDHMPREVRRRLKPFVPRLIGTNDGLDRARAEVLRRVLVEAVLPRASGDCQAASPGESSRRTGPFRRLWIRLLRGNVLRHVGRLLGEAETGGGRGLDADLASAAGHLLGLCARDAWDAREAEWYWNQAIGLLDRLCDVGAQGHRRGTAGARAGLPVSAAGGEPLSAFLGTGRERGRPPRSSSGG